MQRTVRFLRSVGLLQLSVFLLTACGGGGGYGDRGGGNPPPPPPSGSLQPGAVQLSVGAVTVEERSANVFLTINRVDGSDGAISVRVASSDGSASAGQDYTDFAATVSFAAGDSSAKTVAVSITDDASVESDETLSVTLSEPTGGARLGSLATTQITLRDDDPPPAPILGVASHIKQQTFSWLPIAGATHYRLFSSQHGGPTFEQLGADLPASAASLDIEIAAHRLDWLNVLYRLEACNARACAASAAVSPLDTMLQSIGYFKASNTQSADRFGAAIALSTDGRTLAVGAPGEDSNSADDPDNNGADNAGAVYVFKRVDAQWTLQQYIKATNPGTGDAFGASLALSADGNVLVVGAPMEDGINDLAMDSGAAYVYTREQDQWTAREYLKPSVLQYSAQFGTAIALSAAAEVLVVGTPQQAAGGALLAGSAFQFAREQMNWVERAQLQAPTPLASARFGQRVELSADGGTLAVGAPFQSNRTGAVFVFRRDAVGWTEPDELLARNSERGDQFGSSMSLSADGNTLAIGAREELSGAVGVAHPGPSATEDDDSVEDAGAAYVFVRDAANAWAQKAYIKASNPDEFDAFAFSVCLSADGGTLAIGAIDEASFAVGMAGDPTNNDHPGAGAVYVFGRNGNEWAQREYVKASNTGSGGVSQFGVDVALSSDGSTLAVGAHYEDSNAIGVDGDQYNDDATDAGAVYLY